MFGIFIITWRETLEAALIVGILLTYLKKIGESRNSKYIYYGVISAILASLLFAYFSNAVSLLFQGSREEIFQASILFLAVVVLTYMVVWMHHNAREIKGELQQKTDEALARNRVWALTSLAFIGVFREGIETVLFLWGLLLDSGDLVSYYANIAGGFAGIGLAVLMAWLFFKGFGHIDLRIFFRVTGIILLFIAAGMLSTGVGKLIAADILPPIIDHAWNTSWLIDEHKIIGSVLSGIFGYKARPSLMEMLSYFLYFPAVIIWLRTQRHDLAQ